MNTGICTYSHRRHCFRSLIRRRNDNLEQQAQALFKSWFVDSINEKRKLTLSAICESITDGVHNTVVDNPKGSKFLLSCKNIKKGELLITHKERRIDDITFVALRNRTNMSKGDILLSSVGTIGELYLLVEEPENYEFQRSVAILKPNTQFISSSFLYCYLKEYLAEVINLAHGAVQQCIFLSDLRNYEVLIPSKELIDQFSLVADDIFKSINEKRNEIKFLVNIRDTLLPKLMSGELTLNDVNS